MKAFNINHIAPGGREGVVYLRVVSIGSQRDLLEEEFIFLILTHLFIKILNKLLFFQALNVVLRRNLKRGFIFQIQPDEISSLK